MLFRFYELIPSLYPSTLCTMNCHTLIHLCESVERWGPLWCYSTFGFENLNGYIKRHCHGTRNVLPQLIHNVRTHQTLPFLQAKLGATENSATMHFLEDVSGTIQNNQEGPSGKNSHSKLNEEELKALNEAGHPISRSVVVYPRYRTKHAVFSSFRPRNSRNSSTCMFSLNGKTYFGSIVRLCLVDRIPVAIVSIFESTDEDFFKDLDNPSSNLTDGDKHAAQITNKFTFVVKKLSLSNCLMAVSPDLIVKKCIHIPNKHSPTDYIVTFPNLFEKH